MKKSVTIFFFYLIFMSACQNTSVPTNKTQVVATEEVLVAPKIEMPPMDTIPSPYVVDADYLMGKFDPTKHPDFEQIDAQYADRSGMWLRKDAYAAFKKMYAAAKKDGIRLVIRSATRPFDYQKTIWEGKWTGQRKVAGKDLSQVLHDPVLRALKILEYSSMPGTSRHHWGTDFDINAFENSYFEKGEGKKIYSWMQQHATSFGFCQPYTPKGQNRPHGYNEEKWHWSYLPAAIPFTRQAARLLHDNTITGFQGAETASLIGVVEKYVLGISPKCKEQR